MENQLRASRFYILGLICWLIGLASFSSAADNQAGNTLGSFENEYTASLYGLSIDVTSRLIQKGDENYEFLFNVDSFVGSITEVSNLKWNLLEQRVIPNHYHYKRKALGKGKEEEIKFDWINNTANSITRKKILTLDKAARIQDSLSYQLQLRQDLIDGKDKFEYTIANGKKFKKYRFDIVGSELLTTPLGDVKAVKVKRSDSNDGTATYAWFAPEFQYLLVRLQREENDSTYTIYISKAVLNGKSIKNF
jgi:Protein of unknown function (DUF3108)